MRTFTARPSAGLLCLVTSGLLWGTGGLAGSLLGRVAGLSAIASMVMVPVPWSRSRSEQRAGFFRAVAAASPVRRVGTPADVAAAIVYLAGAGFVTGTVLECAGGANLTVGAMAG